MASEKLSLWRDVTGGGGWVAKDREGNTADAISDTTPLPCDHLLGERKQLVIEGRVQNQKGLKVDCLPGKRRKRPEKMERNKTKLGVDTSAPHQFVKSRV